MNWVTHHDGAYWKIESTLFSFIINYGYSWEKNFIRITCKDVVNQSVLTVDGQDYEFFVDDEVSIIEITDLIRATESGTITFVNQSAETILELEYVTRGGERESPYNKDILPNEIPYSASSYPFYVQTDEKLAYYKTDNTWQAFFIGGYMTSLDVYTFTGFDFSLGRYDGPVLSGDTINFVKMHCPAEAVLVEWVGRFGLLKSWWFVVDRIIYNSDRQLDIQTMGIGFNTLRNKKGSFVITTKGAGQTTQHYLSDLVLSDDVYVYLSARDKVRIENNSFEVTKRKRDIQLTVNIFAYDTI